MTHEGSPCSVQRVDQRKEPLKPAEEEYHLICQETKITVQRLVSILICNANHNTKGL